MTSTPLPHGPARHVDGGLPTAVRLRDALLDGEITSVALTERCLERIDDLDAQLHSFVAVDAESALRQAEAADRVLAAGRGLSGGGLAGEGRFPNGNGPAIPALTGLPTAFKDLVDVQGFPTTYGTAALPHATAGADAPIAARLRSSGALLVGKTAVPEFGLSSHSENPIHPPARNPLDPSTSPGGSSGGAAAAVASGMLPLAPGNDGGGSVRIPASACGLVGLKTGLGALPEDVTGSDGVARLTNHWGAPLLATTGPLGRTAADAALLLDGLRFSARRPAATDALDAVLLAARRGDAFSGLRVGISEASPFEANLPVALDPPAADAFSVGIAALERLGALPDDAGWVPPPDYPETFRAVWTAGLAEAALPDGGEERLGSLARAFRREASRRGGDEQRAAAARLSEISAGFRRDWGAFDVLLTPAMAQTPRPIGWYTERDADTDYELQCLYTPYTSMVNVSGLPAVTVPVLWTPDGYSMSVQLIGRAGSEVQLLCLAAVLQAATA